MRNKLEMRVSGLSLSQPDDYNRRFEPGAVREVNRYRVGDMANAAVLVFEGSVVPVGRGLQRERRHHKGQQCGQKSACDVPSQQGLEAPVQMLLRRRKQRNGRIEILRVSLNSIAHTCRTSPSRATIL